MIIAGYSGHNASCCLIMQSMIQSRTTQRTGVEYGLSLLLFIGAAGRVRNIERNSLIPGLTEFDHALASGEVSVLNIKYLII